MKNIKQIMVRTTFILIISMLMVGGLKAQSEDLTDGMTYDSIKAQQYGADQYGMRKYVMAFLHKGPNRDLEPEKAMQLQKAHLQNITRMAEEGKLVLAGPFFDNGDPRGIYIFAVESIEEAENLTNSDPAIQAGSLRMELRPWYGSAALMEVNQIHSTLQKRSVAE